MSTEQYIYTTDETTIPNERKQLKRNNLYARLRHNDIIADTRWLYIIFFLLLNRDNDSESYMCCAAATKYANEFQFTYKINCAQP